MPSSSDWPVYVNTSRFSFILPNDCNLILLSYSDLLQARAKPFFWAVHNKHDEVPGCCGIFYQSKYSPPDLSVSVFVSMYRSFVYSFATPVKFTRLGLVGHSWFIQYLSWVIHKGSLLLWSQTVHVFSFDKYGGQQVEGEIYLVHCAYKPLLDSRADRGEQRRACLGNQMRW